MTRITKKNNKKIIPLILRKDNIYQGYEKKIIHYYKNIGKYNLKGIENVEQYFLLTLLKLKRLGGKDKKYALYLQEYLQYRAEYIQMGFLNVSDYLEYKEIFSSNNDYKKSNIDFSSKKEYEKRKNELEMLGVFNLEEYKKYNKMIEKSLYVYEKSKIDNFISLEDFLNFELREFKWKRDYYFKNNKNLNGINEYLVDKYKNDKTKPNLNGYKNLYFEEPDYYYKVANVKNFAEHFERNAKFIKIRHKYKSEKISENYVDYLQRKFMVI